MRLSSSSVRGPKQVCLKGRLRTVRFYTPSRGTRRACGESRLAGRRFAGPACRTQTTRSVLADLANMTSVNTLVAHDRSGPTIEAGSLAYVTAPHSATASNVQVDRVWAALMQDTQPKGNSLGTNTWSHRERLTAAVLVINSKPTNLSKTTILSAFGHSRSAGWKAVLSSVRTARNDDLQLTIPGRVLTDAIKSRMESRGELPHGCAWEEPTVAQHGTEGAIEKMRYACTSPGGRRSHIDCPPKEKGGATSDLLAHMRRRAAEIESEQEKFDFPRRQTAAALTESALLVSTSSDEAPRLPTVRDEPPPRGSGEQPGGETLHDAVDETADDGDIGGARVETMMEDDGEIACSSNQDGVTDQNESAEGGDDDVAEESLPLTQYNGDVEGQTLGLSPYEYANLRARTKKARTRARRPQSSH